MAPFLDSRWYTSTNVAALYAAAGGAPATTPAQDLVDTWASGGAGSDGFAMVFEDAGGTDAPSIYVKDSGTPANDTDINLTDDFDAFNSFLTYTSPSPKIVRQSDGDLKYCAHNLCAYSNAFSTSAGWDLAATTVSTGQADPDGGSNAFKLVEDSSTAFHNINTATTYKFAVVSGQQYRAAVKVKAAELTYVQLLFGAATMGVGYRNFNLSAGTVASGSLFSGEIVDLGGGWYECAIIATATSSGTEELYIALTNDTDSTRALSYLGDGSSGLYIYQAQVSRWPADTTYLPTTTAARYALPIQHDSSNNAEGLLVEPAATNLVTYSNDLTNAAWTKANMTTAKTATGPGGSSNEATTCTATAGNATALFSITSASAARVTSAYIKRRTGTGNIDLTQNNGGTWTTVAVDSNWTRFDIGPATAANPIVGIRIVTSGDAVDVALFQHEVGSVPTSPIITTGATATRAADDLRKALSALPYTASAASSAYVKFQVRVLSAQNVLEIANLVGGTGRYYVYLSSGATSPVRFFSNGGVADNTTPTISPNTDAKYAFAFDTNDFAHTLDGNTVETDATATLQSPQTTVVFGQSNLAAQLNGLIKEVMILDERTSNTDLVSITT